MSEPIKKYKIVGFPKPDWNQNDETAPDYVKNRTHYTALEKISETREFEAQSADGGRIVDLEFAKLLQAHRDTAKYYDYKGECTVLDTTNPTRWQVRRSDSEVFTWLIILGTDSDGNLTGNILFGDNGNGSFYKGSITVEYEAEEIHTIDPKYIKDMYYSEVEEQTVEIDLTKGSESSSGLELVVDIETAQFIYDNWEKSEFIIPNTGKRFKIFSDTVTETEKHCILGTSDGTVKFALSINLTSCTVKSAIGYGGGMHGVISIPVEHEKIHTIDPKYLPKATNNEIIDMLTQEDMLVAVTDSDGSILSDENDNVLIW